MIKTKDMILASLFAAITFIMGLVKIPLPFSPVPITGQTFAVMLAGGLLNPITAFLSLFIFDLLGIIGIPVFSGMTGGLNVIVGPKGGYILSWPFAAFLTSLILKNKRVNFINVFITYLLFGIIFVYILGITQLFLVTGMSYKTAFLVGALPFIPGDLIKAAIASYLTLKLRPVVGEYEKRQG
ncbi:MAG TPA: biotin transporter BioY [Clostridia bacterium]|nr:biotin transporter BioY [Clostridia bacterium]